MRTGMTWRDLIISVVAVTLLVVLCIILVRGTWRGAAMAQDLRQVQAFAYAFDQYHKKYAAYPCLANLSAVGPTAPRANGLYQAARHPNGLPAGNALRLLVDCGYFEDMRIFFSPRDEQPTDKTLSDAQKALDGYTGPFPCTYAYDPGHVREDGLTVMFGNRQQLLSALHWQNTCVLNCDLKAQTIAADDQHQYRLKHPSADLKTMLNDDLYADDSKEFGWRDSFLQWNTLAIIP